MVTDGNGWKWMEMVDDCSRASPCCWAQRTRFPDILVASMATTDQPVVAVPDPGSGVGVAMAPQKAGGF